MNSPSPQHPSPVSCPLSPRTSDLRLRTSGFTLVEILVVIAIISLLAGVVLLNIAPQMGMGSQAAAKAQIQVLASAVNTYRMAHGRYPTQQQGLDALVKKPAQEPIPQNYPDGGYLNSRTIPLDPWKRPYIYLTPGRQNEPFELLSYGADGEPGGSGANADISSADAQ
jgi:general secretion pathway protein G